MTADKHVDLPTLFLLEDNPTLSAGLVAHLRERFQVSAASSISEAKRLIARDCSFEIAVVDIFLPDGSGVLFARESLIARGVPVVFLSAFSSAEYRLEALEAGGADFIPKPFHLRELLLRLERVLAQAQGGGKPPQRHGDASVVVEVAGTKINLDARTVSFGDSQAVLSVKDSELLGVLIKAAPKPKSREELAQDVWGAQGGVTGRTIDNAVVRLRQALGPAASALVSVRGVGYQWVNPADK